MSDLIMQKGVDDVLFFVVHHIPYAAHTFYNIKNILNVNLPLKFMCVDLNTSHFVAVLYLCILCSFFFFNAKGNLMRFHVRIFMQYAGGDPEFEFKMTCELKIK